MNGSKNFLLLACVTFILSSCAFVNQRVDLTYDKAVQASGGSGEVLISKPKINLILKKDSDWVIGNARNPVGQKTADVVTGSNIGDWINGALIRELSDAGYKTKPVSAMPQSVSKGIEVTVNKLFVDDKLIQQDRVYGAETDLIFSLDIWKDDNKVKTLNVTAKGGEKYHDYFSPEKKNVSLKKALQSAMQQVIPEIIKTFED